MKFSPKLKQAKAEIEAILKKYDIGALVVLHTPGFGESIWNLTPSYSAIEITPDHRAILLKSNPAHYGGDKDKRNLAVTNTVNMVQIFTDTMGPQILALMDTYEHWSKNIDITSTGMNFTSDEELGN